MFITRAGLAKIQEELSGLRTRRLEGGREAAHQYETGGDQWHDNFGWDNARRENGILQGRIERLERALNSGYTIIDDLPFLDGEVAVGTTVQIRTPDGTQRTFTILGELEADSERSVFSCAAPLPLALLGHRTGEKVEFRGVVHEIIGVTQWSELLRGDG